MQRILIIEDDQEILRLLEYNLKQERFLISKADNGADGLKSAKKDVPDLVILDLMLPDSSGFEICKKFKSDNLLKNIPVLILTAKAEEMDRVVGFEVGADDYVTKPFSVRELVLRIRSILKRYQKNEPSDKSIIKFKELVLNPKEHAVFLGSREISLTLNEFKLLQLLLSEKNNVVSRDTILNSIWGYSAEVFTRTVDTSIARLREKLGQYGRYLKSVRSVGYKWSER